MKQSIVKTALAVITLIAAVSCTTVRPARKNPADAVAPAREVALSEKQIRFYDKYDGAIPAIIHDLKQCAPIRKSSEGYTFASAHQVPCRECGLWLPGNLLHRTFGRNGNTGIEISLYFPRFPERYYPPCTRSISFPGIYSPEQGRIHAQRLVELPGARFVPRLRFVHRSALSCRREFAPGRVPPGGRTIFVRNT